MHPPPRESPQAVEPVDVPDKLGSLPAQYAGTLPCGDGCSGIAYWLTLGERSIYVLQQHYNADGQRLDYVEVGHWADARPERLALTPADSEGSGASLWRIMADDRLVALDQRGRVIEPRADFTLQRRADIIEQSFAGTQWFLVNAPDAHQGEAAYIRFVADDDRLIGSTGCNQVTGRYKRDDQRLEVSRLATTRRACVAFEDTEQSMLEALRQTRRARVLGPYLLLFGEAGERSPVAIFQASTDAMPLSR